MALKETADVKKKMFNGKQRQPVPTGAPVCLMIKDVILSLVSSKYCVELQVNMFVNVTDTISTTLLKSLKLH